MKICKIICNFFGIRTKSIKNQESKNDAILKAIEEHNLLTEKANQMMDEFIAAMDGENKWFECSCIETPASDPHTVERRLEKSDCSKSFNNLAYPNHSS